MWFLHLKYFFIFRLSFTASCPEGKVIYKRSKSLLKKIKELGQLPEGTILCIVDVVGLYPNIPHDESLAFLKNFLDSTVDRQVTTDTLIKLAELIPKKNIFEFSDKTYKQIRGTATGTKFAPPYAILFMVALQERILSLKETKCSVEVYPQLLFYLAT